MLLVEIKTHGDDGDFTMITLFPGDPDSNNVDDDDWDFDYPLTAEDSSRSFEDVDTDASFDNCDDDYWVSCGLSGDVCYDLSHPPEEDEFYDAFESEPIATVYTGIEFFDSMSSPHTYTASWFRPRADHWLVRHLKLGVFWPSTILWDTITHFLSPPPPLPRPRVRRCRQPITIPAYPKAWMLMTTCLMLEAATFQGHVPTLMIPTPFAMFKHVQTCGLKLYDRMVRLEEMLVLNTETLIQYYAWNYLTIHNILDGRKSAVIEPKALNVKTEATCNSMEQILQESHPLIRSQFTSCVAIRC